MTFVDAVYFRVYLAEPVYGSAKVKKIDLDGVPTCVPPGIPCKDGDLLVIVPASALVAVVPQEADQVPCITCGTGIDHPGYCDACKDYAPFGSKWKRPQRETKQ